VIIASARQRPRPAISPPPEILQFRVCPQKLEAVPLFCATSQKKRNLKNIFQFELL
jgi:hypothetical protein